LSSDGKGRRRRKTRSRWGCSNSIERKRWRNKERNRRYLSEISWDDQARQNGKADTGWGDPDAIDGERRSTNETDGSRSG